MSNHLGRTVDARSRPWPGKFVAELGQSGSLQAVERFLSGSGEGDRLAPVCITVYTHVLHWADMEETLDTTINTRVPRRVRRALEQVARERRGEPPPPSPPRLRAGGMRGGAPPGGGGGGGAARRPP